MGDVYLERMLRFSNLDALENVDHVFTLGWRLIGGSDRWTDRFNAFKRDEATGSAVSAVGHLLGGEGEFRRSRLGQAGNRPAVMGLIPHDKRRLAANNKLWALGEAVADALQLEWIPDALNQTPHARLSGIKDAARRDAAIDGAYQCMNIRGLSSVVLVDDFVTRGATMADAARSILTANRNVSKVIGFALGKNERREYARQCGYDINNTHIPRSIAAAWDGRG